MIMRFVAIYMLDVVGMAALFDALVFMAASVHNATAPVLPLTAVSSGLLAASILCLVGRCHLSHGTGRAGL